MVIALSGKCCSGKNHVCDLLSQHGFDVIDVDLVAREAFNDSTDDILNIFGPSVVENGVVCRKLVGDILFADKDKRVALESILHPLTYTNIYKMIEDDTKDWIINIPILKEQALIDRCYAVVWIRSPLLLRFIRALKRDKYSFFTVIRRIIAQKKLSVKYLKSIVDIYYIDNSWFSRGLKRDIKVVLKRLRRG